MTVRFTPEERDLVEAAAAAAGVSLAVYVRGAAIGTQRVAPARPPAPKDGKCDDRYGDHAWVKRHLQGRMCRACGERVFPSLGAGKK